jgi:hypothetical protein
MRRRRRAVDEPTGNRHAPGKGAGLGGAACINGPARDNLSMSEPVLRRWHQIVAQQDSSAIGDLLADEAVFHSPVVHTPQRGRALTTMYLTAAMRVFGDRLRYVREIVGERDAVLEFEAELDGIHVNEVDLVRWNDAGQIVDFKVMVRPLKAINLLHQKMAEQLQVS